MVGQLLGLPVGSSLPDLSHVSVYVVDCCFKILSYSCFLCSSLLFTCILMREELKCEFQHKRPILRAYNLPCGILRAQGKMAVYGMSGCVGFIVDRNIVNFKSCRQMACSFLGYKPFRLSLKVSGHLILYRSY